jgi:hypothetical protein
MGRAVLHLRLSSMNFTKAKGEEEEIVLVQTADSRTDIPCSQHNQREKKLHFLSFPAVVTVAVSFSTYKIGENLCETDLIFVSYPLTFKILLVYYPT